MTDPDRPTVKLTVRALAEREHVTDEIILRRLAGILQRRPWHRRVAFWFAAGRARGDSILLSLASALRLAWS